MLKCSPINWALERGVDKKGPGQVPMLGACEHGNELSGFIRAEVLYQLRDL
jgi:predicted deacylase